MLKVFQFQIFLFQNFFQKGLAHLVKAKIFATQCLVAKKNSRVQVKQYISTRINSNNGAYD